MVEEKTAPSNQNEAAETTGLLSGEELERQRNENEEVDDDRTVDHNASANQLPPRSCLYSMFMVFSAFAALMSGVMLIAQFASIALVREGSMYLQDLLHIYLMLFSIMFILSELQIKFFLDRVPAFKNWFHRGFLYSFVGVSAMEESYAALGQGYPELPGLPEYVVSAILKIISVTMTAVGVLYMIMGLLCMRGLWERVQAKYDRQVQEALATATLAV